MPYTITALAYEMAGYKHYEAVRPRSKLFYFNKMNFKFNAFTGHVIRVPYLYTPY